MSVPEPGFAPPTVATDAGLLAERVLRRVGLAKEPEKRGVKPQDVARETKRRLAELRIAGASVAEIQRDTGFTKTVATRLAGEVYVALAAIKAGRY